MPNGTVINLVLMNHLTYTLAMDDVIVDNCHSFARVDQLSITTSVLMVAKLLSMVSSLVRPLHISLDIICSLLLYNL